MLMAIVGLQGIGILLLKNGFECLRGSTAVGEATMTILVSNHSAELPLMVVMIIILIAMALLVTLARTPRYRQLNMV